MNQLNQLMKQAQDMQKKLMQMQEKLQTSEFDGVSGGGIVKVVLNGKFEMIKIEISDELLNIEEKDVLCDLILSAQNDAVKKINSENSEMQGKLGLPPMMGF